MSYIEFYHLLDEITGEPPGTITGQSVLAEWPGWDSLAVLSFMAMLDEHFQIMVSGKEIAACTTADDLSRVVGDSLSC